MQRKLENSTAAARAASVIVRAPLDVGPALNLKFSYRLPLAACSRSMASNNALKLPLPKLFAPFL